MSEISEQTKRCLVNLATGENGQMSASYMFPPSYIGFKGHFPGDPVLPGVCMIEAVLAMLAKAGCGSVRLKRVVSAKWAEPVRPDESLCFSVGVTREGSTECLVKAKITRDGKKIAESNLMVAIVPPFLGAFL